MHMPSEYLQRLVSACERCIKHNQLLQLPKYIKRLRTIKQLDVLMNVNGESLTLLMYFARQNMVEQAQELLSGINAASVTVTNAKCENALFLTISTVSLDPNHDLSFAKLLLKNEAEKQLLQATTEGLIPFHESLYTGCFPLIELLLQVVPDKQLEKRTNNNMSVVDFAVLSKNPFLLEWLFERYSILHELKGKDGFTPLHLAAKEGNLQQIQYLLKSNPENRVMARDDIGMLPILLACMSNHISAVKELLRYYGKQQLEDTSQGSAVFFACMAGRLGILQILFHTAKVLGADLSKVLLNPAPLSGLLGTKFASKDIELEIPLHVTFYSSNTNETVKTAIVDILLSIAPNEQLEYQRKVDRQTALHISIDANTILITKRLIAQNNTKQYLLKDNDGCTAFMFALEHNKKEQAELLFKHGPAEQYARSNNTGFHALIHVMRLDLMQVFEVMVSCMTEDELMTISDQNDPLLHMSLLRPAMLNLLLKTKSKKALLDSRDKKFGNTALHTAINCDFNVEIIKTLLIHGADVNAQDNNGWGSIHIVCSKNNAKYFNLLCQYQPNFSICNLTGETPLHIAAANGHITMVKSLLFYNIDPNSRNKAGLTPLFLAVLFGHISIVEILLQNKADPNQQILLNFSVLKLALYKSNSKIIQILLKNGSDINQIISTDTLQSFKNYILERANDDNPFCQKIKSIMISLHLISSDFKPESSIISYEESLLEDIGVSARNYLKEAGFTIEQIQDFEEVRRYKLTKRNPHEFKYQEEIRNEEIITWLNGAISSTASFILPISSHGILAFCYFDEFTLAQQGCDSTKIECKRLKFDGYHIKELDKSKKHYTEQVKLYPEDSEKQITYTHELKITAVDRILLFPITSDKLIKTNKSLCSPPLYIGLRFIPGGFHTNASIKSLSESMAMTSTSKCLAIQWPSSARLKCSAKTSIQPK